MSKQLKYQLKKTIKKAEFVHADLEYHEEVGDEAKDEFLKKVSQMFADLPLEVKKRLQRYHELTAAAKARGTSAAEEEPEEKEPVDAEKGDIIPTEATDEEPSEEQKEIAAVKMKDTELKKLFRRIAALTHPDKVSARGASDEEAARLESIFKKARSAFERENWFVLYTVAIDLGLEIEEESERHIHWIEQDIKNTSRLIEVLANRTYWLWYNAENESARNGCIRHYFLQIYNYEYPDL
jgi:hypothetical protein|tara:strand:- start:551 stop:1267 length:717 start_codon:yes stop_codon:yes gene_type:complete